jgi:hypothetical protein
VTVAAEGSELKAAAEGASVLELGGAQDMADGRPGADKVPRLQRTLLLQPIADKVRNGSP